MALSFGQDSFYQNMFGGKKLDELSDGIQLLREYIFYNQFNFLRHCLNYDKLDSGKLDIDKFEVAMLKAPFKFSEKHIQQIIEEAPKTGKNEILYRDLNFVLSRGEKPKSKISSKLMVRPDSLIGELGEDINFENVLIQYFGRKQIYDLEHYDLRQIDTNVFKTMKDQVSSPEEAVRNILYSNNLAVIENFQTQVANKIFQKLFHTSSEIPDSELKNKILQFFQVKEPDLFLPIVEIDFMKIMQSLEVKLTLDESNLLYILIYRGFSENTVNLFAFMEWLKKSYSGRRMKNIIKFDEEDIKSLTKPIQKVIEMPELMSNIIKMISEITFQRFEQGLDLITTNGMIEFEAFFRMIKQLDVLFEFDSATALKKYFGEEGVLSLSNMTDVNKSKIVINAEKFLELVRRVCTDLFIPVTKPRVKLTSTDAAIAIFQQAIYNTYWKQIRDRMKGFADNFSMITETKLREVMKNMIFGIEINVIDSILDSLKYNEPVSNDSFQRKIYVDEFWAKITDHTFSPPPKDYIQEEKSTAHEKEEIKKNLFHDKKDLVYSQEALEDRFTYTPSESQQMLTKLKSILEQLLDSDAIEISPDEKGITSLPLLRIFNSYDLNRNGILEFEQFRKILIEFFPILSPHEIGILCSMAEKLSTADNKDLKELNSESQDKKFISYYHLIMQIEKYFTYQKTLSNV